MHAHSQKSAEDKTNYLVVYFLNCMHSYFYTKDYSYYYHYFSLYIVTASTSDHHDLHNTKQEKDGHIAQLTHKLQSVTRERKKSQEIIITLQTRLQEYKKQLLKTKG